MDPIFSLVRKFGQIGPSEKFIFLSFEKKPIIQYDSKGALGFPSSL